MIFPLRGPSFIWWLCATVLAPIGEEMGASCDWLERVLPGRARTRCHWLRGVLRSAGTERAVIGSLLSLVELSTSGSLFCGSGCLRP
jgi:hypothetical protein